MKKELLVFYLSVIACFGIAQTSFKTHQNVLVNNIFMKSNGLTSLIVLRFESNNNYTMRVIAIPQVEVVNVLGTYTLSSSGSEIANLILHPKYINKSSAYNSFQDFQIDKFIYKNLQYDLRKFFNSDIRKYVSENPLLAQSQNESNDNPVYILQGNVNFYSSKIETEAEREARIKKQEDAEKRKQDLEEKLKGW